MTFYAANTKKLLTYNSILGHKDIVRFRRRRATVLLVVECFRKSMAILVSY